MDTKDSGFISLLESFWNRMATARDKKDIVLIVCASEAYWKIDNVVNAKGGLHIRIVEAREIQSIIMVEDLFVD